MITNAEMVQLTIDLFKAEDAMRRWQDDESWEAWQVADAAYQAGTDELIRREDLS